MRVWFSVPGALSTNKTVVRRTSRKRGTKLRFFPLVALGPRVVLGDRSWQKGGVQRRCADNTSQPRWPRNQVIACFQHLTGVLEDLTVDELDQFRYYVIEGTLEGFLPIPADQLPSSSLDMAKSLMEVYGIEGSQIVALHALRTIHRDDLSSRISTEVERLQSLPKESTDDSNLNWMTSDVAQYSCKLSFDANTAHPHLCLSEGDGKATFLSKRQSLPDCPERFDTWPQVLCREGLSGGRFCWDLRWNGYAAIGVAYKSIVRKGKGDECGLGFNKKSWALLCETKKYSAWHNVSPTDISEEPESSKQIRVCLDWPAGTLAFYKVARDKLIHLHTFHATFSAPVYPMVRFYYFSHFGSSVALSQH